MELVVLCIIGVFLFVLMIQFDRIYEEMKKFNRKADTKPVKTEVIKERVKKQKEESGIVGKSRMVFLQPIQEPVQQQLNMPLMSQPLEVEPRVEQPDIEPEEVEVNFETIDVDETEFQQKYDSSEDLSQGITYEQISHAVTVLEGKKTSETDRLKAGETLYNMSADMAAFFDKQEMYLNKVDKLIGSFIDSSGKKINTDTEEFDVKKFIYT